MLGISSRASRTAAPRHGKFRMASSVACDAKGRVYVGDYMNDRIQVFDADGKHLKSIPATKPACVAVHQKTGDIYVFSWMLLTPLILGRTAERASPR